MPTGDMDFLCRSVSFGGSETCGARLPNLEFGKALTARGREGAAQVPEWRVRGHSGPTEDANVQGLVVYVVHPVG